MKSYCFASNIQFIQSLGMVHGQERIDPINRYQRLRELLWLCTVNPDHFSVTACFYLWRVSVWLAPRLPARSSKKKINENRTSYKTGSPISFCFVQSHVRDVSFSLPPIRVSHSYTWYFLIATPYPLYSFYSTQARHLSWECRLQLEYRRYQRQEKYLNYRYRY